VNRRNGRRDAGQGPGGGHAEPARDRPWLREGLILLAFLLIAAAGVVTVVVPQLEEQLEDEAVSGDEAASGDEGRTAGSARSE